MWGTIVLKGIGAVVKAVITPFLWMWAGANWAAKRAAEKSAKVKDDQLEAALDRPRDRDDLVKRLRDGGL